MPAYSIGNVEVHTPEIYDEYRKHTLGTIEKFGGRFIVRGGEVIPMEGKWKPKRVVIVEFPSMEMLKAWYYSPEYQAIIGGRQAGADTDMVFVEGYAPAA